MLPLYHAQSGLRLQLSSQRTLHRHQPLRTRDSQARGRSPIVAALIALLVSRALAKNSDEKKPEVSGTEEGLGGLVEFSAQADWKRSLSHGSERALTKPISPNQLQQALGPETVDGLSRETGLPREDLLSQLSRLLPEVIDKLSPNGKLPTDADLQPAPETPADRASRP